MNKLKLVSCLTGALCVGWVFLTSPLAMAEDCLTITDDFRVPSLTVLRPAITEAYEKAGICVKFENKPAAIAQKLFKSGKSDGLLMRSKVTMNDLDITYITPNEPITNLYNVILTEKKSQYGPTLKAYKNATIGVFTALKKAYGKILTPHGIHIFPYEARNFSSLLVSVEEGSLDGALIDSLFLSYLKQRDPTLDYRFQYSKKLWARDGFLILAPKHKRLIPKLDFAIKKVKPNYPFLSK